MSEILVPLKGIFETVWNDGYITIVICDGKTWRLEGKSQKFNTVKEMENYYKGKIKSFSLLVDRSF